MKKNLQPPEYYINEVLCSPNFPDLPRNYLSSPFMYERPMARVKVK
ncbi:hypothetical protein ASZ90_006856 [hydrocarbon metagenome]|uniref:Uncharacterized protein n=1 Tax=hydrocarbon metagenome TaxID=938273 RepID=A0A0W8FR04_9ZZZZ